MGFVDELDQMIEKIIDEAIDYYMDEAGFFRAQTGNYHFTSDPTWEITPPGKPARTAGGQVTHSGSPAEWGFDYGAGTNSGSLVYGHFEDTIRDVFSWWREIPTPADFDQYLDHFREASWSISVTASSTSKIEHTGNTELDKINFLQNRIGNMSGPMILTFDQNFCTPLPSVIHGQYAVTLLAGTTLCAEKEIWNKAQEDILAIAKKMLEGMQARGSGGEISLKTIAALVGLAAVFPSPGKAILSGAGSVLSSLDSLLNAGSAAEVKPEFEANSPDGVIDKTKNALKSLAATIRGREDEIKRTLKDALNFVTSKPTSFDLPKPELLGETQIDEMDVNLDTLDFIATDTLPTLEKQVNKASDEASYGGWCSDAWYRPMDIGVSDTVYGPYDTWAAVASLAKELTADLAWEIKSSGEHLAIAAEQTGRTEAQIEDSMKRHAQMLDHGSGYDPIGDATKWVNEHR